MSPRRWDFISDVSTLRGAPHTAPPPGQRAPAQTANDSAPPASVRPSPPDGPVLRVLGPVALDSAHGDILSNRKTTALELAAWLVLHPGANAHQIDDVLAPRGRIPRHPQLAPQGAT